MKPGLLHVTIYQYMKTAPKISVCIPVFETEQYLAQCLHSVYLQDFDSFEIIVVSDASEGKDLQEHGVKKIIKAAQKEGAKLRKTKSLAPVALKFLVHSENRGIFEVRRTLCYEARGEYIAYVDSDDELSEGALRTLWEAGAATANVQQTAFDVIHGSNQNFPAQKNLYNNVYFGILENTDSNHHIFHKWLCESAISGVMWAKLIRRDLLLQAYDQIPYTECNMADDALLFFYVTLFAKSYLGINRVVYHYRTDSGMSSQRKITSLARWKMICSAASVFTVISTWLQSHSEVTSEEDEALKHMARWYLANSLFQMKKCLDSKLLPQAHELLCDYWGADFVEEIEKALPDTLPDLLDSDSAHST